MSQRRGVGERVLCVEMETWRILIDFSDFAVQLPDSTIESAESLCLSVQSDQLLSLDESRLFKESGLAR